MKTTPSIKYRDPFQAYTKNTEREMWFAQVCTHIPLELFSKYKLSSSDSFPGPSKSR